VAVMTAGPTDTTVSLDAWHVKSQHDPERIAHWPAGHVGSGHIMRQV
jgi:hypothetical protein